MKSLEQIFATNKIVPVVVIDDVEAALPLAETLLAVGINNMEVTLRTRNALEIIKRISTNLPELIIGAGTILTAEDFAKAHDAGAKYIISPGVSREQLLTADKYKDVHFIPGVVTPSHAIECLESGRNYLKFFPAEPYHAYEVIKSLASPLPQIKFCPTGGISPGNMAKYLGLPNIFAVGMSSIVEGKLIASHDFNEIRRRCEEAISIAKDVVRSN